MHKPESHACGTRSASNSIDRVIYSERVRSFKDAPASEEITAGDSMTDGRSSSWQERLWRRARLHKRGLRMEEYETKYLFSAHWREFRTWVLEAQKQRLSRNICERCPSDMNEKTVRELHVHHKTYERLGEERIEDIEILCRECHDKGHLRDTKGRARHRAPGYER